LPFRKPDGSPLANTPVYYGFSTGEVVIVSMWSQITDRENPVIRVCELCIPLASLFSPSELSFLPNGLLKIYYLLLEKFGRF
jgi:hypothetical protein